MEPTPSLERYWIHQFIKRFIQFSWAGVCTHRHRHYHYVVSHESLKTPIKHSRRAEEKKQGNLENKPMNKKKGPPKKRALG